MQRECLNRGKQGVALVAVLGFLGVMLLLAVSLSIAMRTERLTSEAAKDDVVTRQLLHTALARAMGDVNDFMYDANPSTPLTRTRWLYGSVVDSSVELPSMIHLPRAFAVLPSVALGATTNKVGDQAQLISGEVTDWLPSRYLTTGGGSLDVADKAADADWINIIDPNTNVILGRIAYVIVDCTGLLDVNLINDGGTPVRNEGLSIGEIHAKHLPEVGTPERARVLFNNKSYYHRFDSLPEILYLNDALGSGGAFNELAAIDADALDNLAPYSLNYDRGWWNGAAGAAGAWESTFAGAPIDISAWTAAHAQNVFTALGFANPVDMAACYEDYIDANYLPGGSLPPSFNIPCCEPIPMINEIDAGIVARHDGSNYFLDVFATVELCYPFPAVVTNDQSYTVEFHGLNLVAGNLGSITLLPAGGVTSTPPFTVAEGGAWHQIVTFPLVSTPLAVWGGAGRINAVLNFFDIRVRDHGSGSDVDRPFNSAAPALLVPGLVRPPPGVTQPLIPAPQSLRCNDPRVNHIPSTRCWSLGPKSLGAANTGALFDGRPWNQTTNGTYEGSIMYVRNAPMQSVAELGFLSIGSPWETIDLLSPAGVELMSKFRDGPLNTENPNAYGKINPHSLNTSVWYSVLIDCPKQQYPGDATAQLVDSSLAGLLSKAITDYSADDDSWGTNSFEGLADWLGVPTLKRGANDLWGGPVNNNMQVEGIIRNTYRLFSPNQNLFTIVVIAQAINDQNTRGLYEPLEDVILGEKRAVALVWRDPFPNADRGDRNEMFVRMFRYLDQ